MPDQFKTFSLLHGICLLVSASIVYAAVVLARLWRGAVARRRLRFFIGAGCLAVWVINTAFTMAYTSFHWPKCLPLHFCNFANLIGALAIFGQGRLFKSVIYFWAFALCLWAFLTPSLIDGPLRPAFWIFWAYHIFIPLAVVEVLVVQRFRPGWKDLRNAWLFTVLYAGLLILPDTLWGWDYGFVGPTKPANPTPIDLLGPYPLRLIWMLLIATALFVLLLLPYLERRAPRTTGQSASDS